MITHTHRQAAITNNPIAHDLADSALDVTTMSHMKQHATREQCRQDHPSRVAQRSRRATMLPSADLPHVRQHRRNTRENCCITITIDRNDLSTARYARAISPLKPYPQPTNSPDKRRTRPTGRSHGLHGRPGQPGASAPGNRSALSINDRAKPSPTERGK